MPGGGLKLPDIEIERPWSSIVDEDEEDIGEPNQLGMRSYSREALGVIYDQVRPKLLFDVHALARCTFLRKRKLAFCKALLRSMSEEQASPNARLNKQIFDIGEWILTEGGEGQEMGIVYRGECEVWKRTLAGISVMRDENGNPKRFRPGSCFGEANLLGTNDKCLESVKAVKLCQMIWISRRVFNDVLRRFPAERSHFDLIGRGHRAKN